jgi:hypothetical protein
MCHDHGLPMEQGDHSDCSTEILTCPKHLAELMNAPDGRLPVNEEEVEDGFVPIEIPDNFDEMLEAWSETDFPRVGLCLMCGEIIRSEDDFLPGTYTHNCEQGRAFEEKIAARGTKD